METLRQDLGSAFRSLRRTPGFTLVAILVLALGIGGVSAFFSALSMALLKSAPVAAPERLVWVSATYRDGARFQGLSYPDFLDYRARKTTLSYLSAFFATPFSVSAEGRPARRVSGQLVSGDYFEALGVAPSPGRGFLPSEDAVPGRNAVVVLSYALWQGLFDGDPALLGRPVLVNGTPFTVVGVAPRGFIGLDLERPADVFVPLQMAGTAVPGNDGLLDGREAAWLTAFGRLEPGLDAAAADASLAGVAAGLAREYPRSRPGFGVAVTPLQGWVHPSNAGDALPIGVLLLAVTSLVLLIAGANVAGLLLVRGVSRRREIGIRVALGATRGRLIRLLLTESALLAAGGAALGALLATLGISALGAAFDASPAFTDAIRPDTRVLVATMVLGVATGVLFGLAPALATSRGPSPVRDDGALRSRLQRGLVVSQVALSTLLLVAAGLLLRTLGKTSTIDPGFDPRPVATASFDLGLQGYGRPAADAFLATLSERLRAHPEVEATAVAGLLPLGGVMRGNGFAPDDGGAEPDRWPTVFYDAVSPDYFRTLDARIVRGRDVAAGDGPGAPGVAVINETLASRFWPGEEALGKRIRAADRKDALTVVGVVRDLKVDDVTEAPRPYLYLARAQVPGPPAEAHVLVRTRVDAGRFAAVLRQEIAALDPRLPLWGRPTMRDVLRDREDKRRGIAGLVSGFGAGALLLAALGLYGVISFAVARRTREIGVRMALGAGRQDVAAQFVVEGLRLAGIGAGIGLVASLGVTRLLQGLLHGLGPADPLTFAGVGVLLALVAAAASVLPARRASYIDPARALRAE